MTEARPSTAWLASTADHAFTAVAWGCGAVGVLLPASVVAFLLAGGARVLSWRFLVDRPRGFPLGSRGGIGPAIEGSLALVGLGLAIALPLALGGSLWLAELRPRGRSSALLRFLVECLAAVPSVVYGLFGYAFFVVFLHLGISLLAGSLVLAAVMFPILLVSAQEALVAVGPEVREAALALGVDQTCVVRRILLRLAWPGLLAGVVLAVGHAVGSAAPILFTATVYFRQGGLGLGEPVMTLPTHLYFLVAEAVSLDQAFGTALVLVLALLAFNSAALLVRRLRAPE